MTDFQGVDMPRMTLSCAICNKPMQKSRTSAPEGKATHMACRNVTHGSNAYYKKGCRCDVCKAGQNERLKAFNAKRREESGLTPRDCTLCGEPLAMYTKGPRPFHKACKDRAPQWMREGHPKPQPRIKQEPKPPIDRRSDIRAGYEDGDYARFLNGLSAKVTVTDAGCWEWSGRLKDGYPVLQFTVGKKVQSLYVHRMSIEAREGKPLGVLAAHHKCANSACVNPDHLQPVTARENTAEMLTRKSLEARIAELEQALAEANPAHPLLDRISHLAA